LKNANSESTVLLRFHPGPPGRGSLLVLEYRQPALKRRPIFKAPLRGANAGGDARATMWDGRPRPSDGRKGLGNWPNSRAPLRGA